jgi:hypothetical protein
MSHTVHLADLNPELEGKLSDGIVLFDCPVCRTHRFEVPVSDKPFHRRPGPGGVLQKVWQATGHFHKTLTLSPSIDPVETHPGKDNAEYDNSRSPLRRGAFLNRNTCWHGYIRNGEATHT